MGVKDMLNASAGKDMKQTEKAQAKPTETVKPTKPAVDTPPQAKEPKKDSVKKTKEESKAKNPGGRPTNESKGIKNRVQKTLTLKEKDYKDFLAYANDHDMSFAKFMEKAALEYIENHE